MIEYRPLGTLDECEQAVEVQRQVWGFSEIDTVPSRLFLIAIKVGGQVFGAFDANRMVGFCLSIPGIKRGSGIYLHSHMLGVLEPYRNCGVGRRLKLEQRRDALERGIKLIEWTFDPLELKNAFLNIERLGVIIRRYVPNQYGTSSSKLHAGLPTDRCVAEWLLDHPRTEAILAGLHREREPVEVRIRVPNAIQILRRERVEEAIKIQTAVREKMMECFSRDLVITGLERSADAGIYLLGKWA